MITRLQEHKMLAEEEPSTEYSKDTRKKKTKHAAQKRPRKISVKKEKKGTFTPGGRKIHDPKGGYKRKRKDADVEESSIRRGSYKNPKKKLRKRCQAQNQGTDFDGERTKHTYSGSKMHNLDSGYKRKPKPKVTDVEENSEKLKNPKSKKPRNPGAKDMAQKGGKHRDKKNDYRRKPKHKNKDVDLGNRGDQVRSASIYD